MRINEVEQLVGITKKNIRFYEEQGLVSPVRNETNRYREYSEENVLTLKKIKLLRKLDVPIHEIRRVSEANIPLEDCLERHLILLKRQEKSLSKMQELCRRIIDDKETYAEIEADRYLDQLGEMEKEGMIFVDTKRKDKQSKKKGAIIAGGIMIGLMVFCTGFFAWCAWGLKEDPMPVGFFVLLAVVFDAVILGVLLALRSRVKEIEKGEIYEASKY